MDQSIDKYTTDLKVLASTCNFVNIKDSIICDSIVCGTKSTGLKERLLAGYKLTLQKCLQICRATVTREQ